MQGELHCSLVIEDEMDDCGMGGTLNGMITE